MSREFTVPGLKRIATEVKKRLGPDAVPMSIFARGGFFINEDFVDSDYDIIQLDWTVDGELENFKGSWSALHFSEKCEGNAERKNAPGQYGSMLFICAKK